MKRIAFAVALVAALGIAGLAWAGNDHDTPGAGGHAAHAAAAARYLVISPHTESECMRTLGEVQAMSPGALASWQFGCMDGDHTGYLVTKAANKDEALSNVPANQRAKARAIELTKFTADQVKSFHKK